ncbi:MAG: PorV/PorQ family protein [Candidatus Marinimicrobia bacterium]|nr:PorV/PorQ family protein [Candidatus Neomarinimicrobiota bacterium]MCF7922577.1 PorV/PorQ family protein [Candidatus Neomarinimicrobiota bacterium]
MKKSILFLSLLIPFMLHGQAKVGTSAAPFLGIDVGAVGIALGGSQVARAQDASTIYWNPGATAQLKQNHMQFTTSNWLVGSKFQYAAGVMHISSVDAIGLSFTILDYGREEITDVNNQSGTGQYWDASDMAVSLNYSRMLTDRFSIGGTGKYIQQKIWHESATSIALDVGILFRTQMKGLQIGMSISNFGANMFLDGADLLTRIDIDPDNTGNNETLVAKLKVDDYPLPLLFRLGVAYDLSLGSSTKVSLLADALVPSDNVEVVNTGLELSVFDKVFVRTGLKNIGNESSLIQYSAGGGLKLPMNQMLMSFDYSVQSYEYFGLIHTYGIEFLF